LRSGLDARILNLGFAGGAFRKRFLDKNLYLPKVPNSANSELNYKNRGDLHHRTTRSGLKTSMLRAISGSKLAPFCDFPASFSMISGSLICCRSAGSGRAIPAARSGSAHHWRRLANERLVFSALRLSFQRASWPLWRMNFSMLVIQPTTKLGNSGQRLCTLVHIIRGGQFQDAKAF
jgi:hypothetical protein